MKSRLAFLLIGVIGSVLLQFIPVDQHNPPVKSDIPTPPEVKAILRRACYDCHSHETRWTGALHIAPLPWMFADDVRCGRAILNFSIWDHYSPEGQHEKQVLSWETVEVGEMPPVYYLALHRNAVLSAHERQVLQVWAVRGSASKKTGIPDKAKMAQVPPTPR